MMSESVGDSSIYVSKTPGSLTGTATTLVPKKIVAHAIESVRTMEVPGHFISVRSFDTRRSHFRDTEVANVN